MNEQGLTILWTAFAMFFGIGNALLLFMVSNCPTDLDEAIEYLSIVITTANRVLLFIFITLLLNLVATWIFFIGQSSVIGYLIALAISIMGVGFFILTRAVTNSIIITRLLPRK